MASLDWFCYDLFYIWGLIPVLLFLVYFATRAGLIKRIIEEVSAAEALLLKTFTIVILTVSLLNVCCLLLLCSGHVA